MKSIQLSIPSPCSESWDNMTHSENGKFCGSCEKIVLELSTKTDSELISIFMDQSASVCARIPVSKLNIPLGQTTIPTYTSFSLKAVVLGAALITSLNSWSAHDYNYTETISLIQSITEDTLLTTHPTPKDSISHTLEFHVIDEFNGQPMPFAQIFLQDSSKVVIAISMSDFDGVAKFTLSDQQFKSLHTISVKSIEFDDQVLIWDEISHEQPLTILTTTLLQGDIVMVGGIHAKHPKKEARKERRRQRKLNKSN